MRIGQRIKQEKIGAISHSVGIVTLQPSILNIGGLQVETDVLSRTITSDVTLTANNLYMVYVVLSAGVPVIRISTNVNSIGPAGFSSWKLVGAFYTNPSALFNAFVSKSSITPSTFRVLNSGSGTYNTPAYATALKITLVGGGGGGSGGVGGGGNGAVGGGGGGGSKTYADSSSRSGSGGGGGSCIQALIVSPLASYSYSVGSGGSAGAAGTNGGGGDTGRTGIIVIEEIKPNLEYLEDL
jgi:hypothetical protein